MALLDDKPAVCDQYFHLGQAIDPAIRNLDEFKLIKDFLEGRIQSQQALALIRTTQGLVRRMTSYQPPAGSTPLQMQGAFKKGPLPPKHVK
jgi:hypothetical protein